jgi:hypothetical protein
MLWFFLGQINIHTIRRESKVSPIGDDRSCHLSLCPIRTFTRGTTTHCYHHPSGLAVCVVGSGPVGLRTAIELAMLGQEVTVIEKHLVERVDRRANVLKLWKWVCVFSYLLPPRFLNLPHSTLVLDPPPFFFPCRHMTIFTVTPTSTPQNDLAVELSFFPLHSQALGLIRPI